MDQRYHALLRAELNRVAAGEEPATDLDQRPTEDAAEVDAAAPLPAPDGPAADAPAEPQAELTPLELQYRRWQPSLETLPTLRQRSAAAEQFRRLRSRLLEYRGMHRLKTIMITSAMPQEGKSFTAANLAVSLSQHRTNRVLLIDGDLRRYSLQNYFGCPHEPGLADYLLGRATPAEVVQSPDPASIEKNPGLRRISLIGGGSGGDDVADLSEDSRFGELIRKLTPHFDWIVVDSSPVGLVSDAVNLARHCDGVLLVVRGGVTRYETAQKAQAELQAATILGVVLNAVEGSSQPAYYGYGYSYGQD